MEEDVLETIYNYLITVASKRYKSIIREVVKVELASGVVAKVRVVFVDNSFLDVYWSPSGRYSLHYERRHIDGTVYRHDNAPHEKHRHVRTFPKHFHRGSEDRVEESYLPEDPIDAVEHFLRFILGLIYTKQ
ncbi:MAG: hypothetical protein DRO39_09505 [Thermoprotei archaeon]|nr:MAG: hypothetical protein DRO39_09505 [Thermoprotei archaeon]